MTKYIIFGTGIVGLRIFDQMQMQKITPIAFVDNNSNLWGTEINNVMVISPDKIKNIEYDKIFICSSDYYTEIYEQLTQQLEIPEDKIVHWAYLSWSDFVNYYENCGINLDDEQQAVIKYVKQKKRLEFFNAPFAEKYETIDVQVIYDEYVQMYYYIWNGKKMYLSKKYNSKHKAEMYVKSLLMEQDEYSPHRYLDDEFNMSNDVHTVLDVGAAEGNFALEIIDKAEKVILVESDPMWIEPLEKTFEPYQDKVVIINKFVSDKYDQENITIDHLALMYAIDFIKMDIEGAEMSALKGAQNLLKNHQCKKLAICAYHNIDDEQNIRDYLQSMYYHVMTTQGYMTFPINIKEPCRMVRGIVRGAI